MAHGKQRVSQRDTDGVPVGSGAAAVAGLGRWWWAALGGLVLWGAVVQGLILTEAWQKNPLARVPRSDAGVYWDWAGQIAAGEWHSTTPFTSAPLYPYLLGGVRALGGGLATVYVLQAGLHLATLVLLAYGAARRFGPPAGLVAGLLFVLLQEPAFYAGRVLNCTVQLCAVVLLWLALLRAQRRGSVGAWAVAGLLTGLNCLLNPPMLLGLVLLGGWVGWQSGRGWRAPRNAGIFVGVAALAISLATLHNYLACREFIPISAQAGLTFAHGNGPGAAGTYTAIPGISTDRRKQNSDALRVYAESTGQPATWNGASRYFFERGLAYWRADPMRAVRLLACKLYWFVSGQYTAEIYIPALELEQGLGSWLRAAPLPLAWLTVPALLGLIVLARHGRQYGPELILVLVPLIVVALFWYSPRYRLPALPMLVVTCAWVLWRAISRREKRAWTVAAGLALGASVGLGAVNRAIGFDQLGDSQRADQWYARAWALVHSDRIEEAIPCYRQVLALDPANAEAALALAAVYVQSGQLDAAADELQETLRRDPNDAAAREQLGQVRIRQGRLDEALRQFQCAVQLQPTDADLREDLAGTLLRLGDRAGALREFEAVLQLDPTSVSAHHDAARLLHERGDDDAAVTHLREALRLNPHLGAVRSELAIILAERGDTRGAIETLKGGRQPAPGDSQVTADLAWLLATTPGLPPPARAEALRLINEVVAADADSSPVLLDTQAAALAANGRFAEAAHVLEGVLAKIEGHVPVNVLAQLRSRLELYRANQPYVAEPVPTPPQGETPPAELP